MRRIALLIAAAAVLGCGGDNEVVVTRDQFGDSWPLVVNSAKVLCQDSGAAVLKVGSQRYALDQAGVDRGLPHAREIVAQLPVDPNRPEIGSWPADTEPLRAVCEAQVAASP